MANSKKSTARRQGLLFAAAFAFVLSACVEIDMPTPQGQGQQNQPNVIYVTDSSKVEIKLDSAFVLNLKIIDSSYSYIDARSTNHGNNINNVIERGSENGGGNSPSSTETEIIDLHGGMLMKIKDPSKLDLIYKEFEEPGSLSFIPTKIIDLEERRNPNVLAIVTVGFFNDDNTTMFPIAWEDHYLGGGSRDCLALTISKNGFSIIPCHDYLGNNTSTYICGLLPIKGDKGDQQKLRTLAGITENGELLLLCSNKYLQDAYELLIAYGAIPSQILILADNDVSYAHEYPNMGHVVHSDNQACMYFAVH